MELEVGDPIVGRGPIGAGVAPADAGAEELADRVTAVSTVCTSSALEFDGDGLMRRREASIAFVAVALFVYFAFSTSNFLGAFTSCMAALSTYMWSSSTSG